MTKFITFFVVVLSSVSQVFAHSVPFKYPEISAGEFSTQINTHPEDTIVILGGGPSGLLSAIAMQKEEGHPHRSIFIIEKRNEYSRSNTTSFRPESILKLKELGLFEKLSNSLIFSPHFRFLLGLPDRNLLIEESFSGDSTSPDYTQSVFKVLAGHGWPHYAIKISDFELILATALQELHGVYLLPGEATLLRDSSNSHHAEMTSVQYHSANPSRYEDFTLSRPDLVIIAEGAHSKSRTALDIPTLDEFDGTLPERWCTGAVSMIDVSEFSEQADQVGHISLINHTPTGRVSFGIFRPKDRDLFVNGKMTEAQATQWSLSQCLQESAFDLLKQEQKQGSHLKISLPASANLLSVKLNESFRFDLQPGKSKQFTVGNNIIFTGDAAGFGSPIGGLGISLITSVYVDALEKLSKSLSSQAVPRDKSLEEYSDRVREIVHFWHHSLKK